MRPAWWPIYKRELKTYLHSPSTYVALGLFFLISGAIFNDMLVLFVRDSVQAAKTFDTGPNVTDALVVQTFRLLSGLLLFVIPILTMRLLAAERAHGTFELLATCPISDWSILLGKYFALITVGGIMVVLSSVYPITVFALGITHGAVPETGVIYSSYGGLFLIFSTYAAFGLMASSFTRSQVTAAIITLIGLMLWNMIAEFPYGSMLTQRIVTELSASRHTENFIAGLITTRDLAFYFLASFFCLFIAARALEARRWRVA